MKSSLHIYYNEYKSLLYKVINDYYINYYNNPPRQHLSTLSENKYTYEQLGFKIFGKLIIFNSLVICLIINGRS